MRTVVLPISVVGGETWGGGRGQKGPSVGLKKNKERNYRGICWDQEPEGEPSTRHA